MIIIVHATVDVGTDSQWNVFVTFYGRAAHAELIWFGMNPHAMERVMKRVGQRYKHLGEVQ